MTDTDFFPTGHYMSLYLEADVVQQTFSIWKISWLLPLQHTTRTLRSQRGILQMKLGCWCNWFSSPIPKLSVLNICKVIISCPTPCVCVYFPLFVRLSWRSEGLFIFVETAEQWLWHRGHMWRMYTAVLGPSKCTHRVWEVGWAAWLDLGDVQQLG